MEQNFGLLIAAMFQIYFIKLQYLGVVEESFQLPYSDPGPIVWADVDVRKGISPSISCSTSCQSLNEELQLMLIFLAEDLNPVPVQQQASEQAFKINSVSFVLQTQLRINITIAIDAPLGKRKVKITNPDGQSASLDSAFEVTQTTTTPLLMVCRSRPPVSVIYIR